MLNSTVSFNVFRNVIPDSLEGINLNFLSSLEEHPASKAMQKTMTPIFRKNRFIVKTYRTLKNLIVSLFLIKATTFFPLLFRA